MFNSVGIVARFDRKEALELAKELINHLEAKGRPVFLEPRLAKNIGKLDAKLSLKEMRVDLVITVGGDGTILRTCLLLPKPEPPILAINMGERGFLAEVHPKQATIAVDKCLAGEFTMEHCSKLASFVDDSSLPDALNEVFITTDTPAKLLYAKITKDNIPIMACRADGIIIASQVGSTGYSLSAGGPVLDSDVNALVLTPVCSLSVSRSIVFSASSKIIVEVVRPRRAVVVIDGHYRREISVYRNRVTITKSENKSSFIRFKGNLYRRLQGRLLYPRGERA
jgi:NAD+ kinase